jgi:hypothetical protein
MTPEEQEMIIDGFLKAIDKRTSKYTKPRIMAIGKAMGKQQKKIDALERRIEALEKEAAKVKPSSSDIAGNEKYNPF